MNQRTVDSAAAVLEGRSKSGFFARLLPFMGPAFIASVAYVDPGNFATNIQGGAQFGYLLLWVIVASNLTAMLVQALSAKLGIATGRNLAEMCRERFPRPLTFFMWIVGEVVAMATDVAEFLGAALGFQLLFGISLPWGALLTAIATITILSLERFGFRPLEAVISVMVGVIALCYLIETGLGTHDWHAIARHAVIPQFSGTESVFLASGILGATVMPHVIYLHSALTQGRIVVREAGLLRKLYAYELIDVVVAMGIAGLINASMLIMAASTFFHAGLTDIASIEEAHQTLTPLLGSASGAVFALSLLASGLSSSAVGTMAGQIIMSGFVHFRIPALIRRLITMAPSFIVIAMGYDPTRSLVVSQVVLSFGLPFAVIPLALFTSDRTLMGPLANRAVTNILIWAASAAIVALNIFLIYRTVMGGQA